MHRKYVNLATEDPLGSAFRLISKKESLFSSKSVNKKIWKANRGRSVVLDNNQINETFG